MSVCGTPRLWKRPSEKLGPQWQHEQRPLPLNISSPFFSRLVSAVSSPLAKRSNGESVVTIVRSNAAIAWATWSTVIGVVPKTALNSSTYPGMSFTVRIMTACVFPISIGFWMGPLA